MKRSAGHTAHRVELVRQRAGDPVEQALVVGHRRDVEREDPARREPLAREPEELARREIEGHVGLVVGVDDDQVVALVGAAQERPRVGVVDGQVAGCRSIPNEPRPTWLTAGSSSTPSIRASG